MINSLKGIYFRNKGYVRVINIPQRNIIGEEIIDKVFNH